MRERKNPVEAIGQQYYSADDLARRLRVSKRSVINYAQAGLIDYVRVAPRGPYRFSQSAIEAFLQRFTSETNNG